VIVAIVITIFSYQNYDLVSAYKGFGPSDYVNQKLFPQNFERDFLGTLMAGHYDRSIVMKSYYWVWKLFKIPPENFTFAFMLAQSSVFIFSLAKLLEVLYDNKQAILLIILPVLLTQPIAGVDLARFGTGLGSFLDFPLYYGWAYAFAFLAIKFSFQHRYLSMFASLAAVTVCHITMGLLTSVFVGAWYLVNLKLIFKDRFFFSGVVLLLLVAIWHTIQNITVSLSTLSTEQMNVDDWVKMTRIFCYHWYPITMKIFTRLNEHILLFGLAVGLFVMTFRHHDWSISKNSKILYGMVSIIPLVFISIVSSDVFPIPLVIKIAPHRSSSYLTFFAIIFYLVYISRIIFSSTIDTKRILAWAVVMLLLYFDAGGALKGLPLTFLGKIVLLFLTEVLFILHDKYSKTEKVLSLKNNFLFVTVLALFFYFNQAGVSNVTVAKVAEYFVFPFAMLGCALIYFSNNQYRKLFFAILVLGVWGRVGYSIVEKAHKKVDIELATSYMDAQLWAKANTPFNALFVVDPSHAYAWRDFSARSSYGTFRDWGFVGLAYDANLARYVEGKRRSLLFGVNIDAISQEEINNSIGPMFGKYKKIIRSVYYSMTASDLKEFARQEGVDFFVFNKKYQRKDIVGNLHPVYSNKHYMIVSSQILTAQ